ncbi:MAG: P-II family nitrogen regulator, partial [Lachnospiraceae bacterium]|nr:P-II family nitrogen regulator [Lachnospiraceae bacterium]
EITGLDATEHGLPSAYAGFAMLPEYVEEGAEGETVVTGTAPVDAAVEVSVAGDASVAADKPIVVTGDVPAAEAIPVTKMPTFSSDGHKYTKVEIICKEARFEALKSAMMKLGITGMTVSHVLGCGMQKGKPEYYRGVQIEANLLPKIQVDIVVSKVPVRDVIETAKKVLYTGHIGDGKIFVYDVENVVKVRTGEEGFDALQDVE